MSAALAALADIFRRIDDVGVAQIQRAAAVLADWYVPRADWRTLAALFDVRWPCANTFLAEALVDYARTVDLTPMLQAMSSRLLAWDDRDETVPAHCLTRFVTAFLRVADASIRRDQDVETAITAMLALLCRGMPILPAQQRVIVGLVFQWEAHDDDRRALVDTVLRNRGYTRRDLRSLTA